MRTYAGLFLVEGRGVSGPVGRKRGADGDDDGITLENVVDVARRYFLLFVLLTEK
jgi:hypothetical protein